MALMPLNHLRFVLRGIVPLDFDQDWADPNLDRHRFAPPIVEPLGSIQIFQLPNAYCAYPVRLLLAPNRRCEPPSKVALQPLRLGWRRAGLSFADLLGSARYWLLCAPFETKIRYLKSKPNNPKHIQRPEIDNKIG